MVNSESDFHKNSINFSHKLKIKIFKFFLIINYWRRKVDIKAFKRSFKYICEKCGKFSRIRRDYCRICGAQALRKATKDDYKKVAERVMIEQKEDIQVRAKMTGMLDKKSRILQALIKNDAEYKKLLERKKSGEFVEDLIIKNRDYHEKLKKEDKEISEIAIKWGSSEEGRKTFAKMSMWASLDPNFARTFRIKHELELRLATLNAKIQKNEEEYKKLLEGKNKGEYVDDLIKQNRYTAENLKKSKKNCENGINKLRTEKKDDWKSKIERSSLFQNPEKAVILIESILKIETKLKEVTLTKKERKSLIDQYTSLLEKARIELIKPLKPELLTQEQKKYFREPLLSYFGELARKMEKSLNMEYLRLKKSPKVKKKYAIKTREVPQGVDEEIERLFRFLSKDSFKKVQFLDNLDKMNNQEDYERNLRCEIEFFSKYIVSSYISLRFELIYTSDKGKQELIQQELLKKERKVELFERLKFILDQIIDISLTLYNMTLPEERQVYFSQELEKWRTTLKMIFTGQIKNEITLEKDFEDFKVKINQLQLYVRQDKQRLIKIGDLEHLREFTL